VQKTSYRRVYHRVWWAPKVRSIVTGRFFQRDMPDTTHLHAYYEGTDMIGPLQRDEGILLYGLVRVTRPRTVVEFGFHQGRSAFNFLRAMDDDARLYSYDIDDESAMLARELFGHDRRLRFHHKSQGEFDPADLDGRPVDLVFLDAAHDPGLNRETLERVIPALAPDAIIAVHDTGTMHRSGLTPAQVLEADTIWHRQWVEPDAFEHQPGERATVNWMRDHHPEFAQLHLHTHEVIRWGLTLLQRSERLPTCVEMPEA
jgi:predicted O-methyltransferase YrrM